MSVLTFILTVCALCAFQPLHAFNYTFASPSRTPNHAAYTVIEVPVPTHSPRSARVLRSFGFFRHNPTASVPVTPSPLIQSPIVISPHTQPPTKTPMPLRLVHVVDATNVSSVPNSSVSARPTQQLPSSPVVTTASDPSDDAKHSVLFAPSPSQTPRASSPPLTKRIIAIPLHVSRPQPPSEMSLSASASVHQFDTTPYHVQHNVFVPQREPPSYFNPSPTASAHKVEDMPHEIEHDVINPPSFQIPSMSIAPHPSSLVFLTPSPLIPPITIPPEVDVIDRVYDMKASVPPNGEIVAPLPQPSTSENVIPVEIRFQKKIHASPLQMPPMSPVPSPQPLGLHADLMRNVESGFLLGNTYENNVQPTPHHLYTVTPSSTPSAGPTKGVRTVERHRFSSIKTRAKAANDTVPSPSPSLSTVSSKLEMHGTKMLHRHRRPVRILYRHRLPSLKVEKDATLSTVASPSSSPCTASPEPRVDGVKMLNRHRVPVRILHRHRMPTPKVRKETHSATFASPSYTPKGLDSDSDIGTFTPSPTPSRPPLAYGAKMLRGHGLSSVESQKQDTPKLERAEMTAFGGFGTSSSPFAYKTIGPTPSVSKEVHTAYSTPVVIKSSVPPPSSYASDMHEGSARVAMELDQNFDQLDITSASPEVEDYIYCESVKQCMCAVIDHKLLSTSLLTYCDNLNELNYSFCEQSKEAHIFLQFWTHKEGAHIKTRGMALVNECNLEDIMLYY